MTELRLVNMNSCTFITCQYSSDLELSRFHSTMAENRLPSNMSDMSNLETFLTFNGKSMSTWDRYTIREIKTKTRRFKEESWLDGQHSPSTTASSQ